jgi:mannose-6-phosphate isomerase-like protein (cupin superfamily)
MAGFYAARGWIIPPLLWPALRAPLPAMEETIFFRHEDLREITPPMANGEIKAVFKEVGDAAQHSLQMLYERYEPGADTGEDLYAHEAEEAGIIFEGHIEVTVGDRAQVLGPGDAYLFDSRLPHRFRNIGNAACVVISACTTPTF